MISIQKLVQILFASNTAAATLELSIGDKIQTQNEVLNQQKNEKIVSMIDFNRHWNGHRRVVSSTSSSSTAKPFHEAGVLSRSHLRLSSARQSKNENKVSPLF